MWEVICSSPSTPEIENNKELQEELLETYKNEISAQHAAKALSFTFPYDFDVMQIYNDND